MRRGLTRPVDQVPESVTQASFVAGTVEQPFRVIDLSRTRTEDTLGMFRGCRYRR